MSPKPLAALTPAGDVVEGQFMGVSAPLARARFAVLPLPFERTTSYKKGTAQGPARLLEGSLGVELWDEELRRQTYLSGIHTVAPPPCGGDAGDIFPGISKTVAKLIAVPGRTLFSVGGEHSLSQALIPPFVERWPDLSVLHFDAHADMRPDYEGSPHNHACAMYPVSRLCRLVQIGIRSVGEEEAHLLNSGNTTTFFMHENLDLAALRAKVLKALGKTVYLSIDLDGFDPSVIPGVGTPQPGGFGWYEALSLFRSVIEAKDVVGVDIMELCPLQDTVASELAAAKLMYRLMGYLSAKDRK